MAKRRFEEEWKSAFEGAEATPTESVWQGIELELERASGAKARRQLVAYRWLAAASVTVALGISALYFLTTDQPPGPALTTKEGAVQIIEDQTKETSVADQQTDRDLRHKKQVNEQPGRIAKRREKVSFSDNSVYSDNPSLPGIAMGDTGISDSWAERKLPVLYSFKNTKLTFQQPEAVADPGMVLLAKLADEEKALNKKEDKGHKDEQLWTSIGVGAGTFNPNASAAATSSSFNATGNSSAGMSYSFGAGVGGRLSNRFVLQGGIAYLSQSASYTSSSFSLEAATAVASLDDYIDRQSNLVATSPYEVVSNLQFVSVPVQAGYLILDGDFAVQLNGGIATDFFIQNTLTPDNDNVAKVTQKAGDESPYRSVNFSGLVGTELSYRVGRHYRIALNPGIRYAFNSIYKPDISREITPVTYDVSVRFRYIFN
ncbi:MAG: outer membrane beta-barrel protein [Flammeovirgaceae bacterium]|nr:MAG: outer membrane beta-barrel protein [Flammeovirgaceae bacterium]